MEITMIGEFEVINSGRLLGKVVISGKPFHADAIRVRREEMQVLDCLPEEEAENEGVLAGMYEYDQCGPFQTIQISEHPGEWVLFITPYKE